MLRRPAPGRGSHRRDDRGAAAVIMAVGLTVVLLIVAAFAVDLGMQRTARRDMQALADVVALDLARNLDGRTADQAHGDDEHRDGQEPRAQRGHARLHAEPALGARRACGAARSRGWGRATYRRRCGCAPTPTWTSPSTSLTGVATGAAARNAVAESEESACFRIGSYVASLDSNQGTLLNPLLNALLGSSLNLNLVGYQGLATSNISLLSLVQVGGLGVGTVDEPAGARQREHRQVCSWRPPRCSTHRARLAQASVLRAINIAASTPTIAIGSLINASPTGSSALDTQINVLDLVTGAALVANEGHAVNVPSLGISLPGVVSTTTSLTVIESPRQGCKRKPAETAQVRLRVTATIPARSINVSILGLANVAVGLDETKVTLDLDVGRAIATLASVHCGSAGPDFVKVALSSSMVGNINVNASLGAHVKVTVPLLGSGGLLGQILSVLGLGSLLNPPEVQTRHRVGGERQRAADGVLLQGGHPPDPRRLHGPGRQRQRGHPRPGHRADHRYDEDVDQLRAAGQPDQAWCSTPTRSTAPCSTRSCPAWPPRSTRC
ncbi:pilus assembly protein TadG-related protein [Nocardioides convexus]|uniref:pilus assembly protein TadG-related protein n=1 Tax=Nocardioides convexus TaxID=2712224 RepID=UPI00241858CF|nr:pilus assembly protein TadG-related protein [Nocardioides convexus]